MKGKPREWRYGGAEVLVKFKAEKYEAIKRLGHPTVTTRIGRKPGRNFTAPAPQGACPLQLAHHLRSLLP